MFITVPNPFLFCQKDQYEKSNEICLFEQTWEDVETIHRDTTGLDVIFVEFKDFCREPRMDEY